MKHQIIAQAQAQAEAVMARGFDIELDANGEVARCEPRINRRSFMATVSAVNSTLMAKHQYDAQSLLNTALVKAQLDAFFDADLRDAFKFIHIDSLTTVLAGLKPVHNHEQATAELALALGEIALN